MIDGKQVFDCFTFFNEKELLELRFMEYYDTVDYFVIVEATKTQSGLPHKPIFESLKPQFEKYLDKAIHIVVDDMPNWKKDDIWPAERHQRECIKRGLEGVAKKGDAIFVSDLDEFWNVDKLHECVKLNEPVVFAHNLCHFWMNAQRPYKITGTCYAPYGSMSPQEMRNYSRLSGVKNIKHLIKKDAGWHYSSIGGAEATLIKYNCLCEGDPYGKLDFDEVNYKINHLENLEWNIEYLVGRFRLRGPKRIKEFKKKYPEFFFKNKIIMFKSHFRGLKRYCDFKKLIKYPRKYFKTLLEEKII